MLGDKEKILVRAKTTPVIVKHLLLRPRQVAVGGDALVFARIKERPRHGHGRRVGGRRTRFLKLRLRVAVMVRLPWLWLVLVRMRLKMLRLMGRLQCIVRTALASALTLTLTLTAIRGSGRIKHTVAGHRANRGGEIARVRREHARERVGVHQWKQRGQRVGLDGRLIAGRRGMRRAGSRCRGDR